MCIYPLKPIMDTLILNSINFYIVSKMSPGSYVEDAETINNISLVQYKGLSLSACIAYYNINTPLMVK